MKRCQKSSPTHMRDTAKKLPGKYPQSPFCYRQMLQGDDKVPTHATTPGKLAITVYKCNLDRLISRHVTRHSHRGQLGRVQDIRVRNNPKEPGLTPKTTVRTCSTPER